MKISFLRLFAVIALAIFTLVSCSKKNDEAAPPADPIIGKWVGNFNGTGGGMAFHFAFNIKPGGILESINDKDEVIANGTWKLQGGVFYGIYKYTKNDDVFNLAAKYDEAEGTLTGSWGEGETNPADGDFELAKK